MTETVSKIKIPVSLTALAWWFVIISLLELLNFFFWSFWGQDIVIGSHPSYRFVPSWPQICWQALQEAFYIIIGAAILKGRAWSRKAYVVLALVEAVIIFIRCWVIAVTGEVTPIFSIAIFAWFLLKRALYLYLLYRRPATQYFRPALTLGALDTRQTLGSIRVRNTLAVALLVLAGCMLCSAQSLFSAVLSEWIKQRSLDQGLNSTVGDILNSSYYTEPFIVSVSLTILSAFLLGMGAWLSAFRSRAKNVGVMLIASATAGIVLAIASGGRGLLWSPLVADASVSSLPGQALNNLLLWLGGSLIWPVLFALVGAWLVRRGRAIAAAPVQPA